MQAILLSSEEVAKRAKELYENGICQQVETAENIGKMIIIDVETGEYAIDKTGIESAHYLRNKNRFARKVSRRNRFLLDNGRDVRL
jgi:hypothetical protein